jgi:hypothetical protein
MESHHRRRRPARGPLVLVAALLAVSCVAPAGGPAGAPPALLVLDAREGTLVRLRPGGGGAPEAVIRVPAGATQVLPAPGGGALVLPAPGARPAAVTRVARTAAGWEARPLELEPGATVSHLAVDGRWGVAAYRLPATADPASPRGRCRLALVDLGSGAVRARHPVCAAREEVLSLALGPGPAGRPVAYLGLWRLPGPGVDADAGQSGGRIVALDPAGGQTLRVAAADAVPSALAVVRTGAGAGAEVLCACGAAEAEQLQREGLWDGVGRWLALTLDAESLQPLAAMPLAARPEWLAAAPDGAVAYALSGGLDVGGSAVLTEVDAGGARVRAVLPGRATGLAVDAAHVYVPQPDGDAIRVVARRGGGPGRTLSVGLRPVAVAVAAGGELIRCQTLTPRRGRPWRRRRAPVAPDGRRSDCPGRSAAARAFAGTACS